MNLVRTQAQVATIALALASSDVVAQEVKGAPEALIGSWGRSPAECRSYHRKSDGITSIDKDELSSCGGSACGWKILSHRKTKNGYVLKLVSLSPYGDSAVSTWIFRLIDDGVYERPPSKKGAKPETYVKCTVKDAIAGIGRSTNDDGAVTQSVNLAYSAFYAKAVPSACPSLKADEPAIKKLILVSQAGWAEHLMKHKLLAGPFTEHLKNAVDSIERNAKSGVRIDAEEIPDFCNHVLNAFGSGGRVLPDLITDPRKRI